MIMTGSRLEVAEADDYEMINVVLGIGSGTGHEKGSGALRLPKRRQVDAHDSGHGGLPPSLRKFDAKAASGKGSPRAKET
jgi:hypothetical protein